MTIDEELVVLEDLLRRLKIEYEIFFNGGSRKAPNDLEWRVQSLIKKYSEGKLTFQQRFKYNATAQRYAVLSDLWRQKMKIKEEGYRRPQDAVLGIQGLRPNSDLPVVDRIVVGAESAEDPAIEQLYSTMVRAREDAGLPPQGTLESFRAFVTLKTEQLCRQFSCNEVEYTVKVQDGLVRLKAKALR